MEQDPSGPVRNEGYKQLVGGAGAVGGVEQDPSGLVRNEGYKQLVGGVVTGGGRVDLLAGNVVGEGVVDPWLQGGLGLLDWEDWKVHIFNDLRVMFHVDIVPGDSLFSSWGWSFDRGYC